MELKLKTNYYILHKCKELGLELNYGFLKQIFTKK